MDVLDVRRRNLKRLSDESPGGQDWLAETFGCSSSYISQLCTAKRPVTEKTARKYERLLKKPAGWLDVDHSAFDDAMDRDTAAELVDLLVSLPDAERQFWIRTIREAPRRQ